MTSRPLSDRIRSNVWGLVACFIAVTGTAVVAQADQGAPGAAKSAGSSKQVKKLKRQIARLSTDLGKLQVRLAALEGEPNPVIPATLPPSGPAGGELAGTYPNPTVGTVSGLNFATGTTPASGILFGSDVNLYRASSSQLRTDDLLRASSLSASAFVTADLAISAGTAIQAGTVVDAQGEVRSEVDVVAGRYIETGAGGVPPNVECDSVSEGGQLWVRTDTEQLYACAGTNGWFVAQ